MSINYSTYSIVLVLQYTLTINRPRWLNELGSWITQQLIQAYHKYGMGSCPPL
jgi:hypothetical protein